MSAAPPRVFALQALSGTTAQIVFLRGGGGGGGTKIGQTGVLLFLCLIKKRTLKEVQPSQLSAAEESTALTL